MYEDDDTYLKANVIAVIYSPGQQHNFHKYPDPDWVMFYGLSGETYTIEAANLGSLCSPMLELYDGDGITLLGSGWSKISAENRVYFDWQCQTEGVYFVRAWNMSGAMGKDTEYTLRVYKPEAPLMGVIAGSVTDSKTHAFLGGVKIRTNGNQTAVSQRGEYEMAHPEGSFTLTAEVKGYQTFSGSVSVAEGEIAIKNITLVPRASSTTSIRTTTTTTAATVTQSTTSISSSTTTTGAGLSTTTSGNVSSTTTSAPEPSTTSTINTPSTTTTSRKRLCPVQQLFNGEDTREVRVLRAFRDQLMAQSAIGNILINGYYKYDYEMEAIFTANPDLAVRAKKLIQGIAPVLESSLQNKQKVIISTEQFFAIQRILADFKKEASPEFGKIIEFIFAWLNSEDLRYEFAVQ
jgi:hypothetical protein